MGRRTLAPLALLAVLPTVAACGDVSFGAAETQDATPYTVPGAVRSVALDAQGGNVTVVGTDAATVTVHERLRFTERNRPKTSHAVTGGRVQLRYTCPKGARIGYSACRVDYRVEVPRALLVDATTGSGDLRMTGLTGRVSARSGSGSIQLTGLTGQVTAHAGSGDIHGSGLGGPTGPFSGEAGSGDIDIAFTTTPSAVTVRTGSGDVTVRAPRTARYAVTAHTGSGDKQIDLPQAPDGPIPIKARTGSGDLTLRPI